mmetsp:Transcript_14134/g.32709  ORF Transcript_14134/g.32709 Transcript_14134/m.32709 type:complete len:82 (-) Transcript_14134:1281-1526(-)
MMETLLVELKAFVRGSRKKLETEAPMRTATEIHSVDLKGYAWAFGSVGAMEDNLELWLDHMLGCGFSRLLVPVLESAWDIV